MIRPVTAYNGGDGSVSNTIDDDTHIMKLWEGESQLLVLSREVRVVGKRAGLCGRLAQANSTDYGGGGGEGEGEGYHNTM
jgi:hypothetical protein